MSNIRRIGPDPQLIKQVNEVLAQNRRILEMNAALLRAIMCPPYITATDKKIDINRLEPGQIVRDVRRTA